MDLTFRLGALEDSRLTARRLGAYERLLVAAPGGPSPLKPSFVVAGPISAGRLVRVMDAWSGPPLGLHALWAAKELPRKARAFLDFIAPRLSTSR